MVLFSINIGTKVHRHTCTSFLLSGLHICTSYLIEMHEPQIFIFNYITWNSIDGVNKTVAMKGMVKVKKKNVIFPSFKLMNLYVKVNARLAQCHNICKYPFTDLIVILHAFKK